MSFDAKSFMLKKEQWSEMTNNLEDQLKSRLSVAFLGSASSGKDSAIRALFGFDFGEVSPVPGSTKELRMIDISGNGSFIVINAPGFGDMDQSVDNSKKGERRIASFSHQEQLAQSAQSCTLDHNSNPLTFLS